MEKSDEVFFVIAINQQKIITTSFGKELENALNKVLDKLSFNVPFQVLHENSEQAKKTFSTLRALYEGKNISIQLNLEDTHLPAYTKRVLRVTKLIPVGYVTSYGIIAKAIGGSARAVGNVMASNPFPPIVPCHRVVKSDFSLGGYGAGGSTVKMEFLCREKRGYSEPIKIDVEGRQLLGFPVEVVFGKFT